MKDTWTKLFACLSLQNAILEKAMRPSEPTLVKAPCLGYNADYLRFEYRGVAQPG